MKRTIAVALAAIAIGGIPATSSARSTDGPSATAAHSCSRGKHAVIGGAHKCLARGQFCAGGRDREYHRYGFHCHKRDARGNYHLT